MLLYKLKDAKSDSKQVILEVFSRKFILKSPHRIMVVDTLYNLFKTNSSWFKK